MKTNHYGIRKLQKLLENNPDADWAKEWILCLAYQCSCKKCITLLEEKNIDVLMIDRVFVEV